MKTNKIQLSLAGLALALINSAAVAAVSPQEADFNAAKIEPFRQKNERFKTLEKEGTPPNPWGGSAWAQGATMETALVPDAGDGQPAIRLMNVAGQPSGMFKTWKDASLQRGTWEARAIYRKAGQSSGALVVSGPDKKEAKVALAPTGAEFKSVSVQFEVQKDKPNWHPTFQLYGGTGEGEALFIRSFAWARVGDVGGETLAAEQQVEAAREAEVQAVAQKEAARRLAESKPINGWVRPEAKPVPMTKPLDPPPVTGTTYYVAPSGDDGSDGSQNKPWRTVQYGMNQLQPGDRLYLRGGEYREAMLTFARSGKPDAYITVAGYPGEQAKIINSGGIAVFNLSAGDRWSGINLDERAYLVIRDLFIDAVTGNQAVRLQGPMMLDEYKDNLAKSRGLRHNIWIVGNDVTGGNGHESVLGSGYGSHDIVISNNRIHDMLGGINAYGFSDGTIIEWNTVFNTSSEQDDAGAIKSMAPGVIVRYNTVYDNNRDPLSKKGGWAPASQGGVQWRFLQGVTGIYLDFAMVTKTGRVYPEALKPADPANYVYGNTVYNNNAGIYVYASDDAQVFDNVVYGNGRIGNKGFLDGDPAKTQFDFVGPAGYGISISSNNVKVHDNISYDNTKAGLGIDRVGTQAWNNVLFGNDLAQIHIKKGDEFFLGNNTILAVEKQGPPVLRVKQEFPTVASFRETYPYNDEGTQTVTLKPGQSPLEAARQLLKTRAISPVTWQEMLARLNAKARAAGIGVPVEIVQQAPYDPTGSLQLPLPWALPGIIEFENYDVGGPNVSFSDTTPENQGNYYRKDAVDIKANPKASNGAVVGYTQNGEWLEYTVSVAKAGTYGLAISYATTATDARIRLSLNGKPVGGAITFAATANENDLKTMDAGTIALPQGDGVLRVTIENGPIDLDRLEFKAQAP